MLAEVRHHPFAIDVAIATLFALFGWLSVALERGPAEPALTPIEALGVGLVATPVAWRRRAPLAALGAMTLAIVPYHLAGVPTTNNLWYGNAWLLVAYTAGVHGTGRWRDPIRLASTVVLIGSLFYIVFIPPPSGVASSNVLARLLTVAANSAYFVWIWLFANATRLRYEQEVELTERTGQLIRERETNAQRAVLEERVGIARELHDVVAHHVSLMGVQAGAARRVLATQPRQAEQALATIEATSREAVHEMHRLLGFLRRDQEGYPLEPQPGLHYLNALLTQVRDAGLVVTLTIEGHERPLPSAVDLSAYRIVQEALTNTLRHAGPTTARVTLRYRERALEVEVIDEGRGLDTKRHASEPSGSVTGSGSGILGMRERAGLLGGRLFAGPGRSGGFTVEATLPIDGAPA